MKFYCRMDAAGSLQECFSQCAECRAKLPETLPEGATFNFEPGDGSISVNLPLTPSSGSSDCCRRK